MKDIRNMMELELELSYKGKGVRTLNNDAIVFKYLSHNDTDVHPLQPIFLTLDKTFFKVQPKYFDRHPECQQWYLTTPGKFIDQYSLLDFDINSEILTDELMAFLSYDIVGITSSLVDTLSFLLDPNKQIGLEHTNRIAKIREGEINAKSQPSRFPTGQIKSNAVIDDVFFRLVNYYQKASTYKLGDFKDLFSDETLLENITKILKESVARTYDEKKFDESVFENFNKLILSKK